jgi:hypothetical protein
VRAPKTCGIFLSQKTGVICHPCGKLWVISTWRLLTVYLLIIGVGGAALMALDGSGLLDRPKATGYWEFLLAACMIILPLALMLAAQPLIRVRPAEDGETVSYYARDGSIECI